MKIKNKKIPPLDLETLTPILIAIWRRFHKLKGPEDRLQTREFRGVVTAVQTLINGLETSDHLLGEDYFSQPQLLGAYFLYQWMVYYQQGVCLINELPTPPSRVLDICSGPGSLAFASLRQGAQNVIALDRNLQSLKMGAEVCGRYGYPLTIRQQDCLKPLNVEGKFDLITVGHCLEELFPFTHKGAKERQTAFIKSLLNLLTPDGMLLLVEGSRPSPNHRLLALRDLMVQQGVPVQAPCVWKGECPALKANNYCYAQREFEKTYLLKEIQRGAQINLSSLKMSYLILKSPLSQWPVLPSHDKPYYRVISPSVETQFGKRYYLCGTDGKKNLGSRLSNYPVEARAFEYLKRGELISVEHALENNHHFDIVQDTEIKIEAALNKPIPEIKQEEE